MRVLHLDSSTAWRGGQRQLALLLAHGHGADHHLAAPGSALLSGCALAPVHPWECRGPGRGVRALARLVAALQPDLVAAHTPHAAQKAQLAGLSHRLVVHRRVDFVPSRLAVLRLGRCAGVVAVSAAVRAVLGRAGLATERVRVVWDGVEDTGAVPLGRGRVGAVGALVTHKDHATLVRAASQITWPVHIAGEGPLRRSLAAQARALRASVVLRGQLTPIADFHRELAVLVHCSAEEGLGQAVLEGMMAGLPVVATRAGGVAEAVQHEVTGLLVPPGDDAALARALRRLLGDPSLGARLGAAGRHRAQRYFRAERMAAQTVAAYDAVLGEMR